MFYFTVAFSTQNNQIINIIVLIYLVRNNMMNDQIFINSTNRTLIIIS